MPTRLVLCCDGTWNSADQAEVKTPEGPELCVTNVLKIACRLKKHGSDGMRQTVYYDQGVGTGNALDRVVGGAIGEGLEANIYDSYRFLIANYEPGDEIFLFGFSRGAYTARSIAGMIRRCGILKREHVRMYKQAQAIYRTTREAADPRAVAFRKEAAVEADTPVRCVGVWDTVGSLGIPLRAFEMRNKKQFEFLDTRLSRAVKFAFHALAVDERRHPFAPTLWDSAPEPGQTVRQVWFPGVHSDIGGGYLDTGLSDWALLWMIESAKTAGLEFDGDVMKALGTKENHLKEPESSRTFIYKLQPALDRPVGATEHKTEYFHQSLIRKWKDQKEYRPKPLRAHEARLQALAAGPLNDAIYPVA
jgi:uncharacterized protein (DUF2235 family)